VETDNTRQDCLVDETLGEIRELFSLDEAFPQGGRYEEPVAVHKAGPFRRLWNAIALCFGGGTRAVEESGSKQGEAGECSVKDAPVLRSSSGSVPADAEVRRAAIS